MGGGGEGERGLRNKSLLSSSLSSVSFPSLAILTGVCNEDWLLAGTADNIKSHGCVDLCVCSCDHKQVSIQI